MGLRNIPIFGKNLMSVLRTTNLRFVLKSIYPTDLGTLILYIYIYF